MNIDQNARLTPLRREEMARAVFSGCVSRAHGSREFGVSAKIVSRWTARFQAEGREVMQDRSSRPKVMPRQTAEALAERIITHRRQRLCGRHIAELTGVSTATVNRVLRRAHFGHPSWPKLSLTWSAKTCPADPTSGAFWSLSWYKPILPNPSLSVSFR